MRSNIVQENSQSPRDRRWRQNNFKDINIYIYTHIYFKQR